MEQQEQAKNNTDHLKPWQFKPGQSGNPKGRKPGVSLKESAKKYLASLNDEERLEYWAGMDKKTVWEMAEGKAEAKTEAKVTLDINNLSELSDEELEKLATGDKEGES